MLKAALALAFLAVLSACQKSPPQVPDALQPIAIAYTYQPQSTLVHVAMAKGYFVDEGLAVEPLLHTYGKAALQSLIERRADFATVAETPIMFAILSGEKIAVIANIEASNENNGIVARVDAGISTPADLKGKRVGVTLGTTGDFFLDSLLTAHGLTRQDIVAVALKPEEMQEAIVAKRVAAVSTWNYPLTQIKQRLGAEGRIFYDREIYTETFNIVARQDILQRNPEKSQRVLRALVRAEEFVKSRPEEARAIASAAMKVDPALVKEVWHQFAYHVGLDETLLITLKDEARWALRNKLSDSGSMPDFQSFIDAGALRAVKPEAITMKR